MPANTFGAGWVCRSVGLSKLWGWSEFRSFCRGDAGGLLGGERCLTNAQETTILSWVQGSCGVLQANTYWAEVVFVKTLLGQKWVSRFCQRARFFLSMTKPTKYILSWHTMPSIMVDTSHKDCCDRADALQGGSGTCKAEHAGTHERRTNPRSIIGTPKRPGRLAPWKAWERKAVMPVTRRKKRRTVKKAGTAGEDSPRAMSPSTLGIMDSISQKDSCASDWTLDKYTDKMRTAAACAMLGRAAHASLRAAHVDGHGGADTRGEKPGRHDLMPRIRKPEEVATFFSWRKLGCGNTWP